MCYGRERDTRGFARGEGMGLVCLCLADAVPMRVCVGVEGEAATGLRRMTGA